MALVGRMAVGWMAVGAMSKVSLKPESICFSPEHNPIHPFIHPGLDTCLSIMNVLHKGIGDSKYRPCPLMQQYVDAGWLGQKVSAWV